MAEGLANEVLLLRLAVYRAVRLGHEPAIERAVAALAGALAAERRGGYAEASLEALLAAAAEEVLEEP